MSDQLIEHVEKFIKEKQLFPAQSTLVIGLSGGPDSVFLLHLLSVLVSKYSYTLIAAHLDHGWREESAQDVVFCRELAQKYNCLYVTAHADTLLTSKKYRPKTEALGRILRRSFLEKVAREYSAQAIVLGHHQDDQQETFFIRLLRGASISGLTGIHAKRGRYVRPLLIVSKQKIVTYLDAHNIPYLIDRTNSSDAYLRNRIRNCVIPALEKADSRFSVNFQKTVENISLVDNFLEQTAVDLFTKISSQDEACMSLSIPELIAVHQAVFPYILVHWFCLEKVPFVPSSALFAEIYRFLSSRTGTGKHSVHPGWELRKERKRVKIMKLLHALIDHTA